jgi:hypothetical protein
VFSVEIREMLPVKSVALFNPSYEHEQERSLWDSLYKQFDRQGFRVFEFQCRAVPINPVTAQYVFQARLMEFGKKIKLGEYTSPSWFTQDELDFSILWEKRRWKLDEASNELVSNGAIRLAQTIDKFFETHSPNLIIVYNEIDHPQRLACLAARGRNIPVRILERSPFMGVWMESAGLFDKSRAFDSPLPACTGDASDGLIQMLADQSEGFRVGQHRSSAAVDLYQRPIILLALDNFLWTAHINGTLERYEGHYQPVPQIQAVIECLAGVASDLGGIVLVKPHPSCKEAEGFSIPEGAQMYRGDLPTALRAADVVVGWNSKVLFNSLALEKPTIALGPNPVVATGGCYTASSVDDLPQLVIDSLHHIDLSAKLESFAQRLPALVDRIYFRIDNSHQFCRGAPFSKLVAELVGAALVADSPVLPQIPKWYELVSGEPLVDQEQLKRLPRADRPKVLFEVTRLGNEALYHSCISRYIREMIGGLIAESQIYVTAASWDGDRWQYVDGDPLLDESLYDIFHSPHEPLRNVACSARVITIHHVVHLKLRNYYPESQMSFKKHQIFRVVQSLRKEDYVICDSEATRRDLLCYSAVQPCNISVSHLGVRPVGGMADRPSSVNKIFAIYQNDPRKNTDSYLDVASSLGELAPHWRMALVVPKSVETELLAELESRKCDNVDLYSGLSDEEMAGLMSQCSFSLFVPFYEGFGLPLVESVVYGLPIIASSSSSLIELDNPGVKFVSPLNQQEIVDAVLDWVLHPSKIPHPESFQSQARERFDWIKTVERAKNTYRTITSKVQPRPQLGFFEAIPAQAVATGAEDALQFDSKLNPIRYFMGRVAQISLGFFAHRHSSRAILISFVLALASYFWLSPVFSQLATLSVVILVTLLSLFLFYMKDISAFRKLVDYLGHVRH